ncbi:hypothetical protein N8I77_009476 [Diaporthe amygdali]|uniref:Uncharacterized protein n=1 Tax=Phomopsis amygdali TaxID=1214568 RepID=A0AAD9SB42_PHOAM|nr:hypothetical protein N8I77_009476 [Diaporthe amygdali]
MRRSRLSLKRSLLLSTTFTLSLLAAGVLAQTDDTTSADATTTSDDTATTTASDAMPTIGQTSADGGDTTTATTSAASATSDMPSLSTSDSSVDSDMPTISTTSAGDTAIPTYPAPSVPPTQNAPFMQVSTLPDGTVFICVGAVLGAFALALLLWRAIIACLLHRSVEKAAMGHHLGNDKASFPAPPAPFHKYTDQDSSQNANSGRGVRRTTRGPVPSATPSQTNLFFSPTAGAGNRESVYRDSVYRETPNRDSSYRDSRFLPAGFYAAGTSSPQNMDGHGHSQSISMTNLRPDSRGHPRASSSHSPPESPGLGPQRAPLHRNNISSSSVNLNAPQNGRAPSAFLDDLLGDHPEMFPPQGTTPDARTGTNNGNHPYRQSGRF